MSVITNCARFSWKSHDIKKEEEEPLNWNGRRLSILINMRAAKGFIFLILVQPIHIIWMAMIFNKQ